MSNPICRWSAGNQVLVPEVSRVLWASNCMAHLIRLQPTDGCDAIGRAIGERRMTTARSLGTRQAPDWQRYTADV